VSRGRAAFLAGLLGLTTASMGPAWGRGEVVRVGSPPGPTARDRLDPARLGRSAVAFPSTPSERWRIDLATAIEHAPLVDAAGNVTLSLATGEVAMVRKDGALAYRRRLPCTLSTAPPVRLAAGTTAFLCGEGSVLVLDAAGDVLARHPTGGSARQTSAAPLAREDGGLFVALDEELVSLGHDGTVLARVRLPASEQVAGGLVPFDGGVLFVGTRGKVVAFRPPLGLRELGSLGGAAPRGPAILGERAVAAVVDGQRLVVFDPVARELRTLATAEPGSSFEGLPAASIAGEVFVTTTTGQLLRIQPSGEPPVVIDLEPVRKASALPTIATRLNRESRASPPPIVDPSGAIAFLRLNGPAGLLRSGEVVPNHLASAPCARPVAIVPAAPRVLVLACGNGSLALWSDP